MALDVYKYVGFVGKQTTGKTYLLSLLPVSGSLFFNHPWPSEVLCCNSLRERFARYFYKQLPTAVLHIRSFLHWLK